MRDTSVLLTLLLTIAPAGHAQSSPANPLSQGARFGYGIIKNWIPRAAAKMPEENYSFRPVPEVRSFAQLIGHLADANYRMCSIIDGEDQPMDPGIEKTMAAKADLSKALADSFAYCDKVYTNMTDAAGTAMIKFDAGGEGTRVPLQMPKLTALAFHTQHAFEHYGNIVTYMRLKGIVPPDSELTTGPPSTRSPSRSRTDSTATHADVSGDWFLTVETPNGPITATLSLKIDGGNLAGELNSERGVITLNGTLTPSEIKLTGQLQTLKMVFVARPGTETMSGTVDFVGHPGGSWTASRR